jgi:hypothetical protein
MSDADANVQDDGRVQISFGRRLSKKFPANYGQAVKEFGVDPIGFLDAPRMNVNIMIVGSRGTSSPHRWS